MQNLIHYNLWVLHPKISDRTKIKSTSALLQKCFISIIRRQTVSQTFESSFACSYVIQYSHSKIINLRCLIPLWTTTIPSVRNSVNTLTLNKYAENFQQQSLIRNINRPSFCTFTIQLLIKQCLEARPSHQNGKSRAQPAGNIWEAHMSCTHLGEPAPKLQ